MVAPKIRILIIEDEPDIARGLTDALEFEGFDVFAANLGREGLKLVRERGPDLVILDLMLPDINGFSVCEQIRQHNVTMPVIMLTARSQESDKIRGLEVGADDYVTKPFSVGELVARIHAIFRRLHRTPSVGESVTVGTATIDFRKHELTRGKKTHQLTFYEIEIIKLLSERGGEPVSRDEILEKIWGVMGYGGSRSVDNCVVKLRKKLEDDPANPRHIVTIYGTGYKLLP